MAKSIPASKWVEVIPLSEIEEDVCRLVTYGKDRVLVYRSGDVCTAVAAECTHYGGALDRAIVLEHVLTCPWHGSSFDVISASCESPPALNDLQQYDTRIKDGKLFLRRRKTKPAPLQLRKESGTFLVIGSGAAGLSAAVALRREGFDGRLIIITAEINPPYDRTRLLKSYLSGDADRKDLFLFPDEYYNHKRIEVLMGRQVAQVDTKEKQVVFMDGDYLLYDKLLIATGSIPRTPLIQGTDLPSFFLLRSLRDADSVLETAHSAKSVLIMGAGFVGLETAAVLREKGLDVHIVAPEKVLLADVFGKRIGERIRRLHEKRGVHFHLEKTVTLLGGEGKIQFAQLSDESSLEVDMVLCGIGAVPAVHFFEESGIVENGAVPVDEHLCTSEEGIYAAGEVAIVQDLKTGKRRRTEHWTEAIHQGRHAARCMLGSEKPYSAIPSFWTRQYDILMRFAGYVPKVKKVVYSGNVEEGEFIAAYYRRGRLCAVCGIGMEHEFMSLLQIIRNDASVGKKELRNVTFQKLGYLPEIAE